jgi:hypothetical protein
MPMYVVRIKRMRAEQQRIAQLSEKQKSKGNKVDRAIKNVETDFILQSIIRNKTSIIDDYDLASRKTQIRKGSNAEGDYSATGKQKIRGKSKPPRL